MQRSIKSFRSLKGRRLWPEYTSLTSIAVLKIMVGSSVLRYEFVPRE
jgi:hypothetical protein